MYAALGAAQVSKPRPMKFATLEDSAGTAAIPIPSCGPDRAAVGSGAWTTALGSDALARICWAWLGSVSYLAVTLIRGAVTVISRATGFSTEDRADDFGPGWISSAWVVPTSRLGHAWSAAGFPR